MNARRTPDRDSAALDDLDSLPPLTDARRETLVARLRAVAEPSSSVDHLLAYLADDRDAARMAVVDWALPLVRTDGDVALAVGRPDGATAYLGFVDGEFRATTRRPDGAAQGETVVPREWIPADGRIVPLPVEATPFGD